MSLEQTRAVIGRLYELSQAGDWDAVAEQLTEDFHIVEADGLPYGGVYRGRHALRDLFAHVMGFWDEPSLELHDIVVSNDNAVGLVTMTAKSRHDGSRVVMEIAERFVLRDGKIAAIKPYYFDTALVRRAVGLD